MARLHLIRHGRAAAAWTEDADPDLDEEGRSQAAAMARRLAPAGPLPVVSSPLRRTRSTAAALEGIWGGGCRIEPRVGEIPSPPGPEGSLEGRGAWLARVMAARWDEPFLGALAGWREQLLAALLEVDRDAVVVTHFVAINAAVGEATGDPRTVVFAPGYCSRTVLDNDGGRLSLVELGSESRTVVR